MSEVNGDMAPNPVVLTARKWPAPAKLNLFLHVTARRQDGYHDLQTLFQLIDLYDELQFTPRPDGLIQCEGGPADIPAEENLVVRAARVLQSAAGVSKGANITLTKHIPAGAGLGGGSSNAATTLLVLNRLWNCKLSLSDLAQLGMSLGADVPVFVRGQTAFATGIGENLDPVALGERHYVLVFLPVHVSTAEMFNHPDLDRNGPLISRDMALAGKGSNAFEPIVSQLYPDIGNALREAGKLGQARMTGTGSCIFIEMPDAEAAMKATLQLNSLYNVRAVRGEDQSPVHKMLQDMV